jgi:hypothetical protein
VVGYWEHDNEFLGSIKGREFIDWQSDCQLPKKYSGPWRYLSRSASYILKSGLQIF